MSRNVRQKQPVTPVKARRRRVSDSSSSLDLSDESGYSGVEDISDSDDDDEDVKAAEEKHILTREFLNSPRPTIENNSEDEEDEDEDEEEEEAEEDNDEDEDDDEEEKEEDDDDDAVESGSWEGFLDDIEEHDVSDQAGFAMSTTEEETPAVERRVRFDVPYSSDEDSTETEDENDLFPDIFVDQNALDPSFRREIEDDPDDSSNSGTFWDYDYHGPSESHNIHGSDMDVFAAFDEDDTPIATPMQSQDIPTAVSTPLPSAEDENFSLDGYETDGDTTEEEEIPDPPVRRKIRREIPDEDSDTDVIPIKPRRGQPRVARFNLDASGKKPIAVVNPITRKMMIFTPQRLRRLDLSPEQFNFQFFEQDPQSSPILSNSANLMMSAMFSSNTFGDFMNTQPVGPAEAFFMPSDSNLLEEGSGSEAAAEDEEDDEEKGLKLEDFITFEGDTDDDKAGDNWDADNEVSSTPARPTTASSDVHPLLDHFENNSNAVGAFRRDQINQRLISSRKVTRDSLAFGGSFGTIRGIKDGRLATTNVPISPLRKQKKPSVDLASSPLSTLSQKRKASSDHHQNWGHKKQRSISDVNYLHI